MTQAVEQLERTDEVAAVRLEPQPMPSNITCTQPGRGRIMRWELAWGRFRRWRLRTFRPGYVRRMRDIRRGDCPNCPHDIIDPRDLKFSRNVCGYCFDPQDDRFAWRGRLRIARAGWAELLVFAGFALAVAAVAGWFVPWAAIPPVVFAAFVVSFFRDPERPIPDEPGLVVSPADGVVTDVEELDAVDYIDGPAVKIGIFLSVFNVHVNRNPDAARVVELRYCPGSFFDARDPRARTENEQLWIALEGEAAPHRRMLVRQIAGKIARRIVCELRPGDVLPRGAKIGMIKFGSRTELFLPREPAMRVEVAPGQKVRGGSTILARFP